MSTIRRQSIISSGIVYFGFALGFLNTYLFAREKGGFTPAQYGLTGLFIAIGNIMYSFASLGMQPIIGKFYPYYKDHLPAKKNDLMTWALLISVLGSIGTIVLGVFCKSLVIRKFGAHSPDVVTYYYWIFPFGVGLTLYFVLEAYTWQLKKAVLTNYLREVQFRLFTTVLILLSFAGLLTRFDIFIRIYSFTYLLTVAILFTYLRVTHQLYFSFSISRVTKRLYSKILSMAILVWSGGLTVTISLFFSVIVIAAVVPQGLDFAGIYTLGQSLASLIQAPQRGIISSAMGHLSQAWKDKDYKKIDRIYHRSSINQLIFSTAMFLLIWINFRDAVLTFHLKPTYLQAQNVFLFIGLMRIIDMGTGLNSQILGTSNFWRFDFVTGLILFVLTLPLNYVLTKSIGVTGPAIGDLTSYTVYNGIRYIYLYRKFGMQPFTIKSLYTLLLGAATYLICHILFHSFRGFGWIVLRSLVFITLFAFGTIRLNLSEDVLPVLATVKKRLGLAGKLLTEHP
ncbi:MAG: polysaccharide biosynthesis C-terminal domain-containing protein [Puia sp.]|nr:polysaccharide biosynthesis C-terminal domain-containing protein [Puia sp.]